MLYTCSTILFRLKPNIINITNPDKNQEELIQEELVGLISNLLVEALEVYSTWDASLPIMPIIKTQMLDRQIGVYLDKQGCKVGAKQETDHYMIQLCILTNHRFLTKEHTLLWITSQWRYK